MTELSERRSRLSPSQRALLDRRLSGDGAEAAGIPRLSDRARAPLSFAQLRVWFLEQLDPGNPFFHLAHAYRLRGRLDEGRLRAALGRLVERHEALRTTFTETAGEPVQTVAPPAPPSLPRVDLEGLGRGRETAAGHLAATEARRPFDLARGPLFRARLLRLAPEEHLFLLTVHHIAIDAWSLGLLFRELGNAYAAGAHPDAPPPAAPPIRYVDFAAWQRRTLAGPALERLLAYWAVHLEGAPAALELPTDRPRSPRGEGGALEWSFPAAVAAAARSLARAAGGTPFMALLAVFQLLLARISGQRDVVVGCPAAGRGHPDLEGVVGFFVNLLPLRSRVSGRAPFRRFLAGVRETTLQAYAHQDLPFERLVERLGPERDLSRTPVFQATFVLQGASLGGLDLPPLAVERWPTERTGAAFDLSLEVREREAGLEATLDYRRDLFDRTTMTRLLRRFESLTCAAGATPEAAVWELPLLEAAEAHQLVHEWNDTDAAGPRDWPLHAEIAARAEAVPDAVAVAFGAARLTSRGLLAAAGEQARRLRARGVGPEVPVGVLMERRLELLPVLLGILRAGGCYLPLDPDAPSRRLERLVTAAGVEVVVAEGERRALLAGAPVTILEVDAAGPGSGGGDAGAARPGAATPPSALAYVLHTSGSTGRPKGVMIPHLGIVNRLAWMQRAYRLGPGDRVLQKTPLTFDVSVWELFWPLLAGATVVLARPGEHRDPEQLLRRIDLERATVAHFVPSMLGPFLDAAGGRPAGSLQLLVASGEVLSADLVARSHRLLPAPLHNLYGPTEASVDVTSWDCRRPAPAGVVPIGTPIANTRIHLLDGRLRPVPPGSPGHLHIGGRGLARGYRKAAALTAASFVPDPQGGEAGTRLYATGDLARTLAGGAIDFLGRIDGQIKLRGLRVEPGEVEAALGRHPAVAEAAVALQERVPGDRRLTAWVTPSGAAGAPLRRLARFAGEGRLDGRSPYELPNGLTVLQHGRAETEFLYREIFERRSYVRGGLTLGPGARVIDVGAHVGLFTLAAALAAPGVRIYAFEPVPELFETLRLNAALYGLDVRLFPIALGERRGEAEITYYPHAGLLSGLHADPEEETRVVREFLLARERGAGAAEGAAARDGERSPAGGAGGGAAGEGATPEDLDELLAGRLATRRLRCPLETLSAVLDREGIEEVDLLKVDAEKSEIEILAGVRPEDWSRIRQVAAEVHGDDRLERARSLLEDEGFEVTVEQDPWLAGSDLFNLYARRPGGRGAAERPSPAAVTAPAGPVPPGGWWSPGRLDAELRAFLRTELPPHLIPAAVVPVDALPRTASGKVDRRALPDPGLWRPGGGRRRELGLALPMRAFFEAPTVARLAASVEAVRGGEAPPLQRRPPLVRIDRRRRRASEEG